MPGPASAHDDVAVRVTALHASREDIRRLARRERRAGALWPVPTWFGLGAVVTAVAMVLLDDRLALNTHGDFLLVGDTNTALTLTSVVATGMLAFLGIVFATTLVAIQLAASQYSPRAVRVFVRSRLTKVCLGIFVATFVFSIITLIAIRSARGNNRGFTPVLSTSSVALLVIATLVAFLVFANGTTRLLRVQYLVERIAQDTRPVLAAVFRDGEDALDVEVPSGTGPGVPVLAISHGVLDAVDVGDLAGLAEALGGWFDVTVPVGSYIGAGTPIAIAHVAGTGDGVDRADLAARVDQCLLLSNERTMLQDPGFGFRQLVDIASRALSPAVNDPTTAVQVVDRLTELLGRIVGRADPIGWYASGSGTARVRLSRDGFGELLDLAFVEIIRYGADSPQVARRLHAALETLGLGARPTAQSSIQVVRELLDAAIEESAPATFRVLSQAPDGRGLG